MTATCTRCQAALEDGDLRCSICALAVPASSHPAATERASVLRCPDCGAAIAFSAEAQAPKCGFCGTVMKVEQPVDPVEVAQVRIGFTVARDAATAALRSWLGGRGYFAPRELRDHAVFDSLVPLYWAGWVVNAKANVAWTADSNEGAQRSSWAPHAGRVELQFGNLVIPASRGLRHDECSKLVPYYDLSSVVRMSATGPEDGEETAMIESFDVQRSAARRYLHDAIDRAAVADIKSYIPGTRTRKVKVACLVEGQTTDRAALPAWVLAYRYRDSPYRAIVHGQRADIVFGTSPIDRGKILRLVGGAVAVIVAAIALAVLVGCGGNKKVDVDAPNYVPVCMPTPPSFTPLTGTAAVLATLNVHVDAGGLIMVDTTSTFLLELALTQTGTTVAVNATACSIHIPDVPLAGQDMPIQFEVPDATLTSVGIVTANATLSSADATCANLDTDPITLVLGARLDPSMIQTEALPAADGSGNFTACAGDAGATCATATGTDCACDQEGDGKPGATLIAHNVPAVKLDQVYATLRTTFSLHGQVWSGDLVEGTVDATLDTGVLGCLETDGSMCIGADLHAVQALNPVVSQQPNNPSIFQSVRVPDGTTCDEIIANQAAIFSN